MTRFLATATILISSLLLAADKGGADGASPEEAKFVAGKETKILDPESGCTGYYMVYVPKDYKPDREWPTIFCYHGKTGSPTCWPFKELTEGKGYIIVGMEYLTKDDPNTEKDFENLKRTRKYVDSKLKVNSKLVFMGGFSLGGWSTSRFSNVYIDNLAGLAILGAGGAPGDKATKKVKGMPVFVGVGETDQFNKNARDCSDAYKAKGADVTFEEFKGLGHSCDTNNKALKDWLLKVGPQNQMMASVAKAKTAEKSGKLGEAFTHYSEAGKMTGGEEAAAAAQAISAVVEKKTSEAEALITAKKYAEAAKILTSVAETYAGSTLGEKAQQRIQFIQTDPAVKANIEQAKLDAKADALEAQALAAEKSKEYARAQDMYDSYLRQFEKATHFASVKAHVEELKANKSIQATLTTQMADRECKGWLSTADSYMKNNLPDQAKPYLQKIIDKYDNTSWAGEAKKRLGAIK